MFTVRILHQNRATIEVRHFFFGGFLNFGSSRPPPKTDVGKKKLLPDKEFHGPGTRQKIMQEKRRISDDFGLRNTAIQKPLSTEKGTPSYLYCRTRDQSIPTLAVLVVLVCTRVSRAKNRVCFG